MKILHVGKYFPPFSGGLENYMRDAMVALARRGVESIALVHRHTLSLFSNSENASLAEYDFSVTRAGTWARLLFTPISPSFPWQLRRIIRVDRPDILHLHLPNPSAFWALILPSARRIPWVVHWHADVITAEQGPLMKLAYSLYRPLEQALLRRASAIVATSPPYLHSSEPLRRWLHKCRVAPLGLDTEKYPEPLRTHAGAEVSFQTWGRHPLADRPLQVLAVGRLTYYKGFSYLIEAAARVPEMQLSVVGTGDQMSRLKSLVNAFGLQDRVRFLGTLDDAHLVECLVNCDCLCLPSIERTEAFGMVLLEAMHFGKATIVGDVEGSGMGWVVDDGVTGLKVQPANATALAEALARLANNREEMARLGQQGKRKFDEQFEINHAIAALLEIYHSVSVQTGTTATEGT